jgi:hypothetical protein
MSNHHLSRSEVRAAASRANGAKGGRPSARSEFLRGFAEGAGKNSIAADEHWAAYSRQLSDTARERIESGGYELGKREGEAYARL